MVLVYSKGRWASIGAVPYYTHAEVEMPRLVMAYGS